MNVRQKSYLIGVTIFFLVFFLGCTNKIQIENNTNVSLSIQTELSSDVIDEGSGTLSPGNSFDIQIGKGKFKSSATGSNYSKTIEESLNSSGTYKVEFNPSDAVMLKQVAVGY